MSEKLRIAVEGCGHGTLDQIYKSLQNRQVDLLIICGDFQSIRNKADLQCLNVPPKYLKMGDFEDYYSEKKKAPVLTIFIGGNHEASNYLTELKYGGWVCPNIYYLGDSGVVWYKGLKIMGISRIWNVNHFTKPKYERLPYDRSTIRSVYHVRNEDYLKMYLTHFLNNKAVMISHDWPEGICDYQPSSLRYLLNKKPFFRADIAKGELGSPVNRELLKTMRPRYWFAAHLHVHFSLDIDWQRIDKQESGTSGDFKAKAIKNEDEIELNIEDLSDVDEQITGKKDKKNGDEIELDLDDLSEEEVDRDEIANGVIPQEENKNSDEIDLKISDDESTKSDSEEVQGENKEPLNPTRFLALDKCLPRRRFIEFLDVPVTSTDHISFKNQAVDETSTMYQDVEFLAITKAIENKKNIIFNHLRTIEDTLYPPRALIDELHMEVQREIKLVSSKSSDKLAQFLAISPNNYVQTASPSETVVKLQENPQTVEFIKRYIN